MNEEKYEKIEILMRDGEYQKALVDIDKNLKKKDLPNNDILILLYHKCTIFNILGEYNESIKKAKKLLDESRKQKNQLFELDAFLIEIFAEYRLNKLEHVLKLIDSTEKKIDDCRLKGIEERKSQLLVNKVYVHTAKREIEKAYVIAQQNYELCQEIDDKSHLARAYYIFGWVYDEMGEIDKAVENFHKSLEMREDIGNKWSIAHTLHSLGYSYRNKGELDIAQQYFLRSLEIREKIGNKQDIAWTLHNLGDTYFGKGDFKQAQANLENSLLIFQEIDLRWGIIFSLLRLSSIYENVDNPQLVVDTLEKALYYAQMVENVDPEAYVLFDLIRFLTTMKLKTNVINDYLTRLETINNSYRNKLFNQIFLLAKALILKSSNDTRNRKKARRILQEITEEEVVDFYFTRIAMIHYSELLAENLKKYLGDDILISELTELSDNLYPTQFQQSYSLVAESFLHQTKSALEKVDITRAKELLRKAQYIYDLLDLYNKGPTPFRILFALFIKERCLSELSDLLNVTKGALTGHLKLLTDLDLIKISREEQIRSARMLKKYYTLGEKGIELLQPFSFDIHESIDQEKVQSSVSIDSLMIPRLMIKTIRDTTFLIDDYQDFLEEQFILKPLKSMENKKLDKKDIEKVKKLFSEGDEIKISHLFLTEKQFKIYLELWKEFNVKVQNEVLEDRIDSPSKIEKEKSKYVANICLPIQDMLILERYLSKKKKETHKD